MQMNTLSDDYTVSPQIDVSDVPSIAQAGFKSVICNRPDQENPEPRQGRRPSRRDGICGKCFRSLKFRPR